LKHKREIVNYSIAAAIQNMMLMATSLGVGSLWISPLSTEEIKKLLKIPETLQLVTLVALGYPADDQTGKATRKPLEKMIHYNEFSKNQV
jgi:nitroreductase